MGLDLLRARVSMLGGLFPQQAKFVFDQRKRRCALCTRRSGKTFGLGVWLVEGAIVKPRTTSLYLAITRGHAERLLWPILTRIDALYGLHARFDSQKLTMTLSNRSIVWLGGCDHKAEAEKYRGDAYWRVAIDEGASFPDYLGGVIEDIIDPALADHDGEIVIAGTPGAVCAGVFWTLTDGDGTLPTWPTHRWSVLDNPHLPHVTEEWLQRKIAEKRWAEDNPTLLREWRGRWVHDESALVYRLAPDSARRQLPLLERDKWEFVIGVDLGASAKQKSTAFVVVSHHPRSQVAWVVRAEAKSGMIPSTIARHLKDLLKTFKGSKIVVDAGALGAGYVEEFRKRHALPVEAAEKRDKPAFIELLNGDLQARTLLIYSPGCEGLLDELRRLPWNEDRTGADDRFADHMSDAMLYAWRRLRHWQAEGEDAPDAMPGEPGWGAEEEARIEAAMEERYAPKKHWWEP
jgi:hypothetical protein